jgi:hypothetical protein
MKWIAGASIMALAMGWAITMTVPAATITPDEATLKLLPPETEAVAFFDVASLRHAPLVQEALKTYAPAIDGDLGEFITATGFDPRRDLDKVTVAKIGPQQMLAIAHARFDKFKIEQFIKDKSRGRVSSQAHLGRTIYTDRDKAFSLIDDVIIAGNVQAVKKAIDQMSLPGSMPLRSDLMEQIRTIEAGNQVWAVGDFSVQDLPRGVRGSAPAQEILKSMRSGTYQMRVDQDLHAKGVAHFEDAEAAKNLSEMARGFIAIAKLQVAKDKDLLHLLDGIQIQNSGPSIVVNIDEPGELLKKLPDFRQRK